ncbi:CCA tRNA nucleotidyltransferase [Tunturiibacter gelidoferens]|uniref:tRNA nucleotidyltransferase/poly(A) polymerase n=1 Tax=Tunturiibacter gelidiferens TaxID=3069689 RepID=A0ACC5NW07_9BACT|nr:CCA tRNA nucleotidyltransferase [Edaphobacter lichenicola]MBB5338730.1 tRNA nucleotidyltransferase/poly(A) polymerase [Edaphobacter lichenicola]
MADYIYLLENRLSQAQRNSLLAVREVARAKGLTVFLVGGAVRDMTSGSPVRDLDVVVQGNAIKLKKDIEKAHGVITGENEAGQALFVRFPGGVRMEIGSTLTVTYPKPGKPVVKAATILDDLRRRDFTANAMALSLNDGSYGLLMDPLNGVADIENRELRLVSNYGFIEDPVRMIRAARLMARLGWQMDEKTQARYETGKQEGYISAMGEFHRGYETEEIFHEEDPLRVLRKLEAEGWMKDLFPALSSAKANVTELEKLRDVQSQLQMQGVHPEAAVANFPYLTAKMSPKEVAALKKSFARQGFVHEIEALEDEAKAFAAEFSGKGAATPSQAWKLLHSAKPESILWVAHTSKNAGVQNKFKGFFTEWSQAKQKLPYALMQEMRIVPDLPGYGDLLDKLFFELMDGKLGTVEEMKAYLEPYSPPAPPPPVHLRRPRVAKKDAKPAKSRKKAAAGEEGGESAEAVAASDTSEVHALAPVPAKTAGAKSGAAGKVAVPVKAVAKKVEEPKKTPVTKAAAAPAKGKAVAKAPVKVAAKGVVAKASAKKAPAKTASKTPAKKAVKAVAKKAPVKAAAKKAPAKPVKKAAAKSPAKKTAPAKKPAAAKKVAAKAAPAKKSAVKHAPAKKAVKVAPKKRR